VITRIALVVAGILAGIVIGVIVSNDDGGDDRATTSTTSTSAPALHRDARELLAALDTGRRATFHAHYDVVPAGDEGKSQSIEIEVWRNADRVRQDTITSGGTQDGRVAAFFLGDEVTACNEPVGGSWTCRPAARGQQSGPDALLSELTDQLAGISVRATDDTVAGIPSRCYLLEIPLDAAKVCVRADGVPTLIASNSQQMVVTTIEDAVPDSTFELPAARA
jgi:hypothetical protein